MLHITDYIYLILVFFSSFIFTYLYKQWAIRSSILDIPNERSSHEVAVPRGGGLAIVIVFYLGLTILFIREQVEKELFFALLPGLILALTGFIDDFKNLSAMLRFAVQFICAGIALYFLGGFKEPFGENLLWFWSLITLVGIVWFINLFNFMDGSDGYASMEALSVSLALYFFTQSELLLLLVFSVGGFLFWNWPKAKIFLGDVGSTTLGFVLIIFGVYFQNTKTLEFDIWLILTALFWFDATITLLYRFLNKEKLSQAHRQHIYQRLLQSGYSHLMVLILGILINILIFILCYLINKDFISLILGYLIIICLFGSITVFVYTKYSLKN